MTSSHPMTFNENQPLTFERAKLLEASKKAMIIDLRVCKAPRSVYKSV